MKPNLVKFKMKKEQMNSVHGGNSFYCHGSNVGIGGGGNSFSGHFEGKSAAQVEANLQSQYGDDWYIYCY